MSNTCLCGRDFNVCIDCYDLQPAPQPSAAVAIADAQARQLLVSGQHKAAEYEHPHLNITSLE